MKRSNPRLQRLTAIAFIAFVLLTFPFLGLARGLWGGLPAPLVYIFAVWAVVIALAAFIAETRGKS